MCDAPLSLSLFSSFFGMLSVIHSIRFTLNKILLRACDIGVFMRVNGRKKRTNGCVFHLPQLVSTDDKNALTKNLQFQC